MRHRVLSALPPPYFGDTFWNLGGTPSSTTCWWRWRRGTSRISTCRSRWDEPIPSTKLSR